MTSRFLQFSLCDERSRGSPLDAAATWRKWAVFALACAALGLGLHPSANAAPFGDHGTAIPPIHITGGSSTPVATLQQSDGMVIVVGTADGPIASTMFAARYSAAGVIDPTYGLDGIVYVDIPSDLTTLTAGSAVLDAAGNLVVVGQGAPRFPGVNPPIIVVARLLSSGLPDPTFGVAGLVRPPIVGFNQGTSAAGVAMDSQNRIVVGGGAHDSSGGTAGMLALRLLASGAMDTAFNGTGYRVVTSQFSFPATNLVLTAADGVVLAGDDSPGTSNAFAIAKLTSSGALDSTFGGTGVVHLASGHVIAINANGNLLVGSQGTPFPQDTMTVTRLTAAGAVDSSFGTGGTAQASLNGLVFNPLLGAMRVDSAGRIVLAVSGSNTNGAAIVAIRFTPSGLIDAGFGASGIRIVSGNLFFLNSAVLGLGAGNDIYLSGGYIGTFVAHLTVSGALDTNFNGTGSLSRSFGVESLKFAGMVRQADGKLVILGWGEDIYSTAPANFVVARLTLAGALDTSFNGTGFRAIYTGNTGPYDNSIALDGTGRIVLASRDYANNFQVVRLLSSGVLDPSFNGTGMVSVADSTNNNYRGEHGLAVDSLGNVLLVSGSVIRLAVNGTVDATFGIGGRAPLLVSPTPYQRIPIAVDGSDRPLIGGADSNGVNLTFAVARLTLSGLPDPTFGTNGVAVISMGAEITDAGATALTLDAGGKILFSGPAATITTSLMGAARLTSSGALDPSFNVTGFNTIPGLYGLPSAMTLDPSGKIVVTGGGYTTRFAANGAIDSSFNAAQLLATSIPPGSNLLQTKAVVADAGGIYVGGTGGRAMAVVRLFDSVPTKLAILFGSGSDTAPAATPFDVIVQAQDNVGNPQPVVIATSVAIALSPGTGTLLGPTACTIPAGKTFCTITGVAYPAAGWAQLHAAVTSGDALGSAISWERFVFWAKPTVTISTHTPDPSDWGLLVTVTASVSAPGALIAPTGFVDVKFNGVPVCQFTLPASSCTFTPNTYGAKPLFATYQGDSAFDRADSPAVTHTVNPSPIPPVFQGASSRKVHGIAAGPFNLPLSPGP